MTTNTNCDHADTITWASRPSTTIDQIATEIRVTRRAYAFAKACGDDAACADLDCIHTHLMGIYRRRILAGERQL